MHIGFHTVAARRFFDDADQLVPGLTDVEVDGAGAVEQAVQVAVEMNERAVVEAEPLPHPVADEKRAVEHRHLRFVSRQELSVDVDEHRLVAHVRDGFVGSSGHRARLRPAAPPGIVATRAA